MSNPNLGWLFYKDYFRNIDWDNIDKDAIKLKVDKLIGINIEKIEEEHLGNIHFKANTTYPGLLLGSGNAHKLSSVEGQAILGFDFDYTSGLPIIRGSSIKGVLRSAFKHWEYIAEISNLKTKDEVENLEDDIFENKDIFFDATIVSSGKILVDDYLAPHKNSKKIKDKDGDLIADELCDPTPLRFIKVAPNVTFKFDFELSDGVISKEEKTILFAEILRDLGVGAKTNVGYGKFNSNLVTQVKLSIENEQEEKIKREEKIKEEKKAENEAKELASIDSNVEKIKIQIKDFTKKETKNIYDIIVTYKLDNNEKKELLTHLKIQIGEKPKLKNKAAIKWAIKSYELLEK